MDIIRKDATITNTNTTEDFPGAFEVILSAPTKDRDGETLLPEEWKQPLPEHITFDADHGMSVATTVGSGVPRLDGATGNLIVSGTYSSLPRAQEVRTLVNEGHIRTASVAFMAEKTTKDGTTKTTRELLNGAFVAIPSNREALVLASKDIKAGARNSASDMEHIQAIHDHAVALGATAEAKSLGSATVMVDVDMPAILKRLDEYRGKSVAGSLEATQDRVRDALEDAYPDKYAWLRATLPDYIVFDLSEIDGPETDTFKQSYTDDGSVVTLTGDATPVDLTEVVRPDPDEDGSSEPAPASAAAPAKAAAPAETKAADDDELQTRVRALQLSASTYTD